MYWGSYQNRDDADWMDYADLRFTDICYVAFEILELRKWEVKDFL
jgi:hypothetical protein